MEVFLLDNTKFFKKDNNGFTLVEITVVVIILLILASILIPTFAKYLTQSYDEKLENEAKTVFDSCQMTFYELYGLGIHSNKNDCIIEGDADVGSNASVNPTTYRKSGLSDIDIHNNPIAKTILENAEMDITKNEPCMIIVATGRYDIYANPNSPLYDPIKAYTVYMVGYEKSLNRKFLFLTSDGKKDKLKQIKKISLSNDTKKYLGIESDNNNSINVLDIDNEQIYVQVYGIKMGKTNSSFLENQWGYINNANRS